MFSLRWRPLSKALERGRKQRAFPSEGDYSREGSERRGEDVSVCVGISGPVRQQREEGKVRKEIQKERKRDSKCIAAGKGTPDIVSKPGRQPMCSPIAYTGRMSL